MYYADFPTLVSWFTECNRNPANMIIKPSMEFIDFFIWGRMKPSPLLFRPYKAPWPESASELYRPSDLRLCSKLVPLFADIGWHVVSVTDFYGRIVGFLKRSRYFFFQVAPQFYSRSWVDPVPDPLLLRKSDSARNRTRTSGSVARNSDH
jgi:hypothetical protein